MDISERAIHLPRHQLVIPLSIYLATDLNCTEKMFLSEIIWLQDYAKLKDKERNYCYAQNRYFKAVFGLNTRQVSSLISNLSQKGYIKAKYQSGVRIIKYKYSKCFDKDISLGLKPKQE